MKVAVIYPGKLRTWEQCRANQEANLLNRYDCDLFWFTYEDPGYRGQHIPMVKRRYANEGRQILWSWG